MRTKAEGERHHDMARAGNLLRCIDRRRGDFEVVIESISNQEFAPDGGGVMRSIIGIIFALLMTTTSHAVTNDEVVVGAFMDKFGVACRDIGALKKLVDIAPPFISNEPVATPVERVKRDIEQQHRTSVVSANAIGLGCTLLPVGQLLHINHDQDIVGDNGWVYHEVCLPTDAFNTGKPLCLWVIEFDLVVRYY
jgi:hypothetical protein